MSAPTVEQRLRAAEEEIRTLHRRLNAVIDYTGSSSRVNAVDHDHKSRQEKLHAETVRRLEGRG